MSDQNVEEFKLNIDKRCDGNCTCDLHPPDIKASRQNDGQIRGVKGFFRYTHELEGRRVFRLRKYIGRDYELEGPLPDVKRVSVYYWTKAPSDPLLLEAETRTGIQYYYRYRASEIPGKNEKIWTYDKNISTQLQERLDDRNCGVNGPTVFDLKTPLSNIISTKSSCVRAKTITENKFPQVTSPQNYTIKEYNVTGEQTRISRVTYGKGTDTTINPPNEPVSTIRVYSWEHAKDMPLLIEFVKDSKYSSGGSEWVENTHKKSTTWNPVTGDTNFYDKKQTPYTPKQALTTKLTLLNCRVNHFVEIDVSQKPDDDKIPKTPKKYCHTVHGSTPKIKVQEILNGGKLFNYLVYEHIPNSDVYKEESEQPYKFIVSKFKNGPGTPALRIGGTPGSYIADVTRVVVYFCPLQSDDPLLIYYQTVTEGNFDNNIWHHWFKNESNTWKNVPDLSNRPPDRSTSYPSILDELDKIGNKCQPPSVTINIEFWPTVGRNTYDGKSSQLGRSHTIKVGSNEDPDGSKYKSFTHTVDQNARGYFTVEKVEYNGQPVSLGESPIEKVTEFSVYYWEHLGNKGNPLLIKIEKDGQEVLWYENKSRNANNDNWHKIQESHVTGNNLHKKLILLNCKLNNVTRIDLGRKPGKYCHDPNPSVGESSHSHLIKVTDITKTPPYNGNIGKFVVYEHSLSEEASKKSHLGNKFQISGFKNSNRAETPVQLQGDLPIPALNAPKVLVFWCSSEPNGSPLLVHFKRSTTPTEDSSIDEWYKKDGESWIKLDDSTGKPSSERDTNAINKILNSYETKCKDRTMFYILIGVPAALGPPGIAYGIWYWYNFLRGPWLRLM